MREAERGRERNSPEGCAEGATEGAEEGEAVNTTTTFGCEILGGAEEEVSLVELVESSRWIDRCRLRPKLPVLTESTNLEDILVNISVEAAAVTPIFSSTTTVRKDTSICGNELSCLRLSEPPLVISVTFMIATSSLDTFPRLSAKALMAAC
jgi:hypothetical protein